MAASSQLFNVTELLELILLNVSQIDLFVTQRVNKRFNATIRDSQTLQKKMLSSEPLNDQKPRKERPTHYSYSILHYPRHSTLHHPVLKHFPWLTEYVYAPSAVVPTLVPIFVYEDEIGWKGRSGKVHVKGSWRRIAIVEGKVSVHYKVELQPDYTPRNGDPIPTDGTLGEVFDAVECVREREK